MLQVEICARDQIVIGRITSISFYSHLFLNFFGSFLKCFYSRILNVNCAFSRIRDVQLPMASKFKR